MNICARMRPSLSMKPVTGSKNLVEIHMRPLFFHVHFSLLFNIAIQASGLKFLRDKGIIHRDLKVIYTFVNLQIAFRAFNNNNK